MKILTRILCSPFILAIMLFATLIKTIELWVMHVRYGGELITYNKGDQRLIHEIYELLKEKLQ